MSRTISFSLTDIEYSLVDFEARSKGLQPSSYAKMATFSHMNKYGGKGVFSVLNERLRIVALAGGVEPTFVGSGEDT